MIIRVFAIYDGKAHIFGQPFFQLSDVLAVRACTVAAQDPQSMLSKCPADFTLFALGSFDDERGVFTGLPQPENLGFVSSFLVKESSHV